MRGRGSRDELLEKRRALARKDARAQFQASLVALGLFVVLLILAYLVASQAGLEGQLLLWVLTTLVVLGPAAAFIMVAWLRWRLWWRAAGGEMARLRAVQFVSHYVDAIGEERLRDLNPVIRGQVERVLQRERQGHLPELREYGFAVHALTQLQPSDEPAPGA